MKGNFRVAGLLTVVTGLILATVGIMPEPAFADSWLPNNVALTGFIRGEMAIKTNNKGNPANLESNPWTTRAVVRPTNNPAVSPALQNMHWIKPVGVPRHVPRFNYHVFRGELTGKWRILPGKLALRGHLVGIADPGGYSNFNWADVNKVNLCVPGTNSGCGIQGGDPALYGGAPNYFQYRVMDGPGNYDHHPVPLEWDMPNGQVYFQSLFLEYHGYGLDVRFGQQQIAWGNAIFFRVFDTANGLDLRRHSLFDYAQEEFADKRVPAPALRVMWQATHNVNVDAYVEKFQPTMFGNPETSYNPIPSQFTVYDHYKDFETRLNEAIRIQWHGDQWSLEAMFGRRYNPWGAYSWTQSQVNRSYPNLAIPGALSAGTPFSSNPTGATSAYEWFNYAGMYRFNGFGALNTGISEFPASGLLGGVPVATPLQAFDELNAFHDLANGLRGYLARQYFHEYNIGLGAGYTTNTGSANSFWNQILFHLEVRYTPDRTLTSPDASTHFLRTNDWVGALEIEKYYRFIQALPSTYMVLEYMHRERTDLFGRALAGYGAHPYVPTNPACMNTSGCSAAELKPQQDPRPHGLSGANYVVFAAQQPFANHVWSTALATLFDVHGGILVQPAVQWAPSSHWRMTMFYNYVNGHLWGNPNNNLFGKTTQYANELAVRVQYAF